MAGDSKAAAAGPIGRNVARNAEDLRRGRLPLRALSARFAELGRPVLPIGLSRLMTGQRRADVDDLVVLALALDVNPNALLLPRDTHPDAEVELTAGVRPSAWAAWAWADGRMPLPAGQDGGGAGERFARGMDFARNARPAFAGRERSAALAEIYELADRHEAWSAESDPVNRGALQDRLLRQFRQVVLQLEEDLADEDADAAGQLREAARTLRAPVVDYAEPEGGT